jgi:hypothetical protein
MMRRKRNDVGRGPGVELNTNQGFEFGDEDERARVVRDLRVCG